MNTNNKRKNTMEGDNTPKRLKKECSYGEKCYRRNPAHFREFSHAHLESILDNSSGTDYVIPDRLSIDRHMILEQLEVIVEKKLYEPKNRAEGDVEEALRGTPQANEGLTQSTAPAYSDTGTNSSSPVPTSSLLAASHSVSSTLVVESQKKREHSKSSSERVKDAERNSTGFHSQEEKVNKNTSQSRASSGSSAGGSSKGSDYIPIVPPTRRPEQFLKVVLPAGKMAAKHADSAPYHIFYTTISDCKETHRQPFSITFLELLDSSLGELKCSLQINFMVEPGWLLAQYYFAGYSAKKLTILYEDDCGQDLKNIQKKKPHVDAHYVTMATPFGKHHTKMMLLCYEDGSLRVVVSTANLYQDDWENRTQGLWLSPACPELGPDAMPHDGESPTMFKRSLLNYLHRYNMPALSYYIDRVKRCDFSQINVFLVASVPGGHFDMEWGLTRIGSLLRQHCVIPPEQTRQWPLVAQASSLGSYGKGPQLWLTGDFLNHFSKIKNQSQMLSQPPELKLIYPSLENVQQSHDGLLGGGCLPYSADNHAKQPWLNDYLYQWKATHTARDRAMPHIKSYLRTSVDGKMAAFYLLTSANVSKAAWGQINKGNAALRIMSYEAGVLFAPKFVINQDFFPLSGPNALTIPYDLPPTKYAPGMSPWVQDYLRD